MDMKTRLIEAVNRLLDEVETFEQTGPFYGMDAPDAATQIIEDNRNLQVLLYNRGTVIDALAALVPELVQDPEEEEDR